MYLKWYEHEWKNKKGLIHFLLLDIKWMQKQKAHKLFPVHLRHSPPQCITLSPTKNNAKGWKLKLKFTDLIFFKCVYIYGSIIFQKFYQYVTRDTRHTLSHCHK